MYFVAKTSQYEPFTATENQVLDNTLQSTALPDIAKQQQATAPSRLRWVGMSGVEMPLQLNADTQLRAGNAKIKAQVSLDNKQSRGIHMSRLYLACDRVFSEQAIDFEQLENLSKQFINSHRELSHHALIEVQAEILLRRSALISEHSGWRAYPIKLSLENHQQQGILKQLEFQVCYSSTCPCSAALARHLIQEKFAEQFDQEQIPRQQIIDWLGTEQGINATPHSQRSTATITVEFKPTQREIPLKQLIDTVEDSLQTPVQAAVKRIDEQAFALRNGKNLMFCEDAARRIKHQLKQQPKINRFEINIAHHESLHPHDAVASVSSED